MNNRGISDTYQSLAAWPAASGVFFQEARAFLFSQRNCLYHGKNTFLYDLCTGEYSPLQALIWGESKNQLSLPTYTLQKWQRYCFFIRELVQFLAEANMGFI
jgi:hypothetical protein